MPQIELPHWLQFVTIVGREDDEDKDTSEENEEENEDGEDDDEGDKGSKGEGTPEERMAALEQALEKERQLRRKAEREARKAKKKPAPEQKSGDDEETKERLTKAETRTAQLARGFLDSKVEAAILEEARKQGFIDPTDALINDVRKEVDADQDEDDPTDVEVDLESVEDAVKALAKKKKHLIGEAGSGVKSGGKFRRKSADDKASEPVLAEHYPSLR